MSAAVRVVTLTAEELERLIEDAVRRAMTPVDAPMTADEVAALLSVKRSTIPTLVKRDGLPGVRIGRAYRFQRAAVIAWVEARAEKPRGHSRQHGATLALLKRKG